MKSETELAEEADKMIESQPEVEIKPDPESSSSEEQQPFPYLLGLSTDLHRRKGATVVGHDFRSDKTDLAFAAAAEELDDGYYEYMGFHQRASEGRNPKHREHD